MTSSATDDASAGDLSGAADRLTHEFAGVFGAETIRECLDDSRRQLGQLRIRTYEGLLAYRFARERLRASAAVSGALVPDAVQVLLVCTHNAGRSQLAAALLRRAAGDRAVVRSAGTEPAQDVHPAVRSVLEELGVAPEDAFPKPLTQEYVAASDVVVTMGCGDACPVLPGRRYVDWDLPDPEQMDVDGVRALCQDIDARVSLLLHELLDNHEGRT